MTLSYSAPPTASEPSSAAPSGTMPLQFAAMQAPAAAPAMPSGGAGAYQVAAQNLLAPNGYGAYQAPAPYLVAPSMAPVAAPAGWAGPSVAPLQAPQLDPQTFWRQPSPVAYPQNWGPQVQPQAPSPSVAPTEAPSGRKVPSISRQDLQALIHAAENPRVLDSYLDGVSDGTVEVLQHFGAEAPAVLNHYAMALEDALIRVATEKEALKRQIAEADLIIDAAAEESIGLRRVLTNPELLSSYVNEYFHPRTGVVPVELPSDRLQDAVAQGMADAGLGPMVQSEFPETFQRPRMAVTPPNGGGGRGMTKWELFEQVRRTQPQMAWMVLDQFTPDDYAAKPLVYN